MDTIILIVLAGCAVCCLIILLKTPNPQKFSLFKHPDAASQLRYVMAASFYKKKVMNKSEYRVFKVVESEVSTLRRGYRVLSQTSLGEIVGSDDTKAYFAVNSKRVDVLILGPYGEAVAAIEYQGGGHHQGSAAARDAIKREALRKAGIHFVEVLDSHSNEEIAQMVRKIVKLPQAA
ncbi:MULTISPECIES: DUF2726 domain-containing protein [unclassified Mesorhizobium]|uniref:DUF2726 domain-containing protein n=1 Tax=unclassified Mesorhizobium TaxID=325217 RepID=UPI0006F89C7B|nr:MULTISPECIES: DUF2726 domain-containing protein [unclassified Mesorhizobium]MDR7031438.1 hypothetical protein [Mesorhizobium sp. BE184]